MNGDIPLDSSIIGTPEYIAKFKANIETQRKNWNHAVDHHRGATHFNYFNMLDEIKARDQRRKVDAQCQKTIRAAGMGSINPSLGTAGCLPDLKHLRGKEGTSIF